jgi:hypothetical protein
VQSLLRNGAAFDQVDEAENEANKFSDYGALPREEAINFNQHANFRIKSTLISNSLPKIHRCSFIKGPMSEQTSSGLSFASFQGFLRGSGKNKKVLNS